MGSINKKGTIMNRRNFLRGILTTTAASTLNVQATVEHDSNLMNSSHVIPSQLVYIGLFNGNVEVSYEGYERQEVVFSKGTNINEIKFPQYQGSKRITIDSIKIYDEDIVSKLELYMTSFLHNGYSLSFQEGDIKL